MTTVLICDDHRIVREGLRQFVAAVPGVDKVETAASGEEVLARLESNKPTAKGQRARDQIYAEFKAA